jgi:hypothetical protein
MEPSQLLEQSSISRALQADRSRLLSLFQLQSSEVSDVKYCIPLREEIFSPVQAIFVTDLSSGN